jgi:hypothetical protein
LKMTIYLHLVSKSQTHETAHPLFLYTSVSRCLGRGQLCLLPVTLCVPQFNVALIMNLGRPVVKYQVYLFSFITY